VNKKLYYVRKLSIQILIKKQVLFYS